LVHAPHLLAQPTDVRGDLVAHGGGEPGLAGTVLLGDEHLQELPPPHDQRP
jgi:hypothetical protein